LAEIKEEIIKNIENGILKLEEEQDLSFDEILNILKKREVDRKTKTLPISIFNNKSLSALETVTKYLKENLNLNYSEIAALLSRNYDPIRITYRNSKKKLSGKLDSSSDQNIPIEIFRNKVLSVLENLTSYLKDVMGLTYHEIAVLLNRNDRTIWTVYNRVLKKKK
jgi:hypothetical protein